MENAFQVKQSPMELPVETPAMLVTVLMSARMVYAKPIFSWPLVLLAETALTLCATIPTHVTEAESVFQILKLKEWFVAKKKPTVCMPTSAMPMEAASLEDQSQPAQLVATHSRLSVMGPIPATATENARPTWFLMELVADSWKINATMLTSAHLASAFLRLSQMVLTVETPSPMSAMLKICAMLVCALTSLLLKVPSADLLMETVMSKRRALDLQSRAQSMLSSHPDLAVDRLQTQNVITQIRATARDRA
jgi:hypothetical protein